MKGTRKIGSRGWHGDKYRHKLASKGVRTKNLRIRANGIVEDAFGNHIDIDQHYWGLELHEGEWSLRLGNWSDAGWYWSGDEEEFAGFIMRLTKSEVKDEFIKQIENHGIDFMTLKPLILRSAEQGDGIYMITGDNNKWHFGYGYEGESEIIRYDVAEDLSKEDLDKFEEYYWDNNEAKAQDFDAFEESHYYNELKKEVEFAIDNSFSWEELLDNIDGIYEIGEEMSYSFSDEVTREDIYARLEKWKEERHFADDQKGIPTVDMIQRYIEKYGKQKAITNLYNNFTDFETETEVKKLVEKYQQEAIRKGWRKVEEGQKTVKEFEGTEG